MVRGSNLWITALVTLYFLVSYLGSAPFSFHETNIVQISVASGIGMIGCLYGGKHALFTLIAASSIAYTAAIYRWEPDMPLLPAFITGALVPFASYLSAYLWRQLFNPGGLKFESLIQFVLLIGIFPGLLFALIAASDSLYGFYNGIDGYLYDVYELTSIYTLSILLVVPFYHLWIATEKPLQYFSARNLLLITLYLLLTFMAFVFVPGLIFVGPIIPVLLAFRGEELAALAALFGMGLIVSFIAPYNLGPFDLPDKLEGHTSLLTFVLVSIITPLSIGLHVRRLHMVSRSRDIWQSKARTDQLTGLPNRYAFFPELARIFHHTEIGDQRLVVAMIDVDHFKSVNDNYGHATGDRVLAQIAVLMQEAVRDSDIVARVGGEEFAIIFPGGNKLQAERALERLRMECEKHVFHFGEIDITVTLSIGAAVYQPIESKDALMGRADSLLYQAKEQGRNRTLIG